MRVALLRARTVHLRSVIAGLDPAIHLLRKNLSKRMDARVKPAHDEPVLLRRGKILPRRHQLPGAKHTGAAKNRWFTGFFGMARRLLTNFLWSCGPRPRGICGSLSHVACPRRTFDGFRRAAIADREKIFIPASHHRLQPDRDNAVRHRRRCKPSPRFARSRPERRSVAGDHERAARGAGAIIEFHGFNQPLRRAEGPVLATRRRWRWPGQQIGIRECAGRRRHQRRAGRRCLQQARQEWRRLGQSR